MERYLREVISNELNLNRSPLFVSLYCNIFVDKNYVKHFQ